jgi:FlaA1/EpsC-like NDP-sugar epimerase
LSQVRNIDLEDLLGRDAVTIDTPHVEALLNGKVVMVTGRAVRSARTMPPDPALFAGATDRVRPVRVRDVSIDGGVARAFPDQHVVPIIGDAKDLLLLDQLMSRYAPHIVFHAAAYKHVPLMEEHNAWQALRNNVLGTYRVARAAIRHGVRHFVLISTDKAVNPTNVMGASKRLAEMTMSGSSADEPAHAIRNRAVRQRARQRGQRNSEVSATDLKRRPGDGHTSGSHDSS